MNDLLLEREALTFLPAYEPPLNDLEREIARLIAEQFKLDKMGRHDDFFELGGDSLAAVALAEAFEQRFGVAFQSGALIEHSTVSALALHIGSLDSRESPPLPACLTAVQADGPHRPLFYVHGALGITFLDRRFLELIGSNQPLYLFHLPGVDAGSVPMSSVEELAAHYIAAMREVRPEGPYAIAANCACCLIGFEMAVQLVRAGEQVSTLLLVDPGDAPAGDSVLETLRGWARNLKRAVRRTFFRTSPDLGENEMLPDAEWDKRVEDFAKSYRNAQKKARWILDQASGEHSETLPVTGLADEAGMAKALTLLRDALVKYRPTNAEGYAGKAALIVSEGRLDHVAGWQRWLGNAEVHRVPGNHADIFEQHLDVTARAIKNALEQGKV